MSGDIVGNTLTPIDFLYNPQTFTTAEAEFEIRTSEFDFEPQILRVVGSAKPQKIDVQQFYGDSFENLQQTSEANATQIIKKKNRTLLTDKSTRRTGQQSGVGRPAEMVQGHQLEKIPEKAFKKTLKKEAEPEKDEAFGNLKNIKMTEDEKSFLIDYRKLEDLEREKGIKFFECVGDPPATD